MASNFSAILGSYPGRFVISMVIQLLLRKSSPMVIWLLEGLDNHQVSVVQLKGSSGSCTLVRDNSNTSSISGIIKRVQ